MGQSLTKYHHTTSELVNAATVGDAEFIRKVKLNFTSSLLACIALAALLGLNQVEEQSYSKQNVSCILIS